MVFIIIRVHGGKNKCIMNNQFPVISCICVTRGKSAMLKRAIECFTAQSYQQKELVIVYEDDDTKVIELVETIEVKSDSDICLVCIKAVPKTVLGELRNIGVRAARGEFICQWDDDDWYHMNRLMEQYVELTKYGREGAVMTQWLVFDSVNRRAYISNARTWEGSILCRKPLLENKSYEQKGIGEDTATIDYLVSIDCLHFMHNVPGLYIYVYHGSNTWNQDHWNYIFKCSTPLSYKDSTNISDILNGKYTVCMASLLLDEILERQYSRILG